jgi:hypothetical protein
MPVAYGVQYLAGTQQASQCGTAFSGATDTAWMRWFGPFSLDGYSAGWPSTFVIATRTFSSSTPAYPPAALANKIFRPVVRGGFGVQLPRFIWTQYASEPGRATNVSPPTNVVTNC